MTERLHTYDPTIAYRHPGLPVPRPAQDDVVNRINPSERPAVPPVRN